MGKKLIERIKYWLQILMLPVYWLSFLIPRDKKIWVFGSTFGRRFADNPRYFYLYITNYHMNEISPIWISQNKEIVSMLKSKGCVSYYKYSLMGIWMCLRGGVYLYDNYPKDISHWLSGGAIKINLWHGIPLKKIQNDNIYDKIRHPEGITGKLKAFPRRLSDEKPSHYVLTTSEYERMYFQSAFRTKRVLVCGYPRNDVISDRTLKLILTDQENVFINKIKKKSAKFMVLYMPTFRDSEIKFFDALDLKEFNQFLEKNEILFCCKLHCKSKLRSEFEKIQGGNIIVIDPETDPYVYIEYSDVLVTDYSSIFFDYMLTKKPIVFFHYDLEDYITNSRELYFEYNKVTPGRKLTTGRELMIALSDIEALKQDVKNNGLYDDLIQLFFDNNTSRASEKLYHLIEFMINKEGRK